MQVQLSIESILREALQPLILEVVNESHMHSVPANSETHFKVTLVADAFEPLRKVQRHQHIYRLLKAEIDGPVHALALHTWTPAEWEQRGGQVPDSPNCLGGSKKES